LCRTRKNVILLTCDYDLHDIKDNLIRSAIEKYTLNNLLTRRLKDHDRLEALETGNIRVRLSMKEIRAELESTFRKMKESEVSSRFLVAFYDRRDKKVYGNVEQLPMWLMDFVLDYRLNLICYSDYAVTEMKYPINYIMNPSEDLKQIDFNITLRKDRQYYGLIPDCEDICSPARRERDA